MPNKSLLDGVNEVLKRVSIIRSSDALSSLTNSGKQVFIDLAVQAWNESVDQLYSKTNALKAYQGEEDTLTLQSGVRVYSLPDDLIQMRWPLHDEVNGFYIHEHKGGYEELRHVLVQPDNRTGIPTRGALSIIEKEIYLDNIPTPAEDGYQYTYFYWRDTVLEKESDRFPFDNAVFRAMVPVVTETWRLMQKGDANGEISKINYGRALRMIEQKPDEPTYIKRGGRNQTGPLGFDPYR